MFLLSVVENKVLSYLFTMRQKNLFESSLDSDEIRLFFGILIITGYAPKLSRRSHWQNNMDLRNRGYLHSTMP